MELRLIPTVPIVLDRPRLLRLDLEALYTADERLRALTGEQISMWDMLRSLDEMLRPRHIRFLLWAGLLHEDPELTPEAVGRLVHLGNMNTVVEALVRARAASLPEPEPTPSGPPEDLSLDPPSPRNGSTGSVSGPPAVLTSA